MAKSSGSKPLGTRSGHISTFWMGRYMSVRPSWAMMEPSTYSTMEWMVLWGWMTTSTRSGATPNRWVASIISKPLFIRVALSMEILGPMFHVGWRSASSGVTAPMASACMPRKGPPLAVRISRRMDEGQVPSRHWKMALCSLSMGSMRTPRARAASITRSPAVTSTSLLARATVMPRSMALSVGIRPTKPTVATTTMSAS